MVAVPLASALMPRAKAISSLGVAEMLGAMALSSGAGATVGAFYDKQNLSDARKRIAAAQAKSSHSMHSATDSVDY